MYFIVICNNNYVRFIKLKWQNRNRAVFGIGVSLICFEHKLNLFQTIILSQLFEIIFFLELLRDLKTTPPPPDVFEMKTYIFDYILGKIKEIPNK